MTDLIVMHIAPYEKEDVLDKMRVVVDGELDLLANVTQLTDWETVIKASVRPLPSPLHTDHAQHYKLDQEPAFKDITGRNEEERAKIDNVVISSVAMKYIMA